jgi:enoyl-CoA hydratase
LELAEQLAKGSATALAAAKAAIDFGIEQPLSAGLVTEQKLFSGLFGGVDQGIGMKSFIENGPGKANFS